MRDGDFSASARRYVFFGLSARLNANSCTGRDGLLKGKQFSILYIRNRDTRDGRDVLLVGMQFSETNFSY